MSTFRRLLGTAQKALDSRSSGSSRPGQSSDWRSLVRSAADSLTGDGSSSSGTQRDDRSSSWQDSPAARHSGPGQDYAALRQHASSRGGATDSARTGPDGAAAPAADLSTEDRRAIARYDYLVRTAEPDQLERVHREAFERLTPQQRAQLTATLRSELPEGERPRTDAPQDLARSATRLGALDPRRLTSLLGRSGAGRRGARGAGAVGAGALGAGALGAGALGAGGLLAAVAGGAVATSVGGSMLQDALGAGIDIDALAPDLAADLGGLTEGIEGFGEFETIEGIEGLGGIDGGFTGLDGVADGLGGTVSGLGDRISDLGLGDLFGR